MAVGHDIALDHDFALSHPRVAFRSFSEESEQWPGEKVKLGGLERWLRPRGRDSVFLCPAQAF
jgi:hypothetical protein